MYVDGFNVNTSDTEGTMAVKKADYVRRLEACTSTACFNQLFKDLGDDCIKHKNKTHCWHCDKFGGPESSGTYGCP